MAILEIVNFLEHEFGVKIVDEAPLLEKFQTIASTVIFIN